MAPLDQALVGLFLGLTLFLGLRRGTGAGGTSDYLLAGRRLTLPAFVATTVSSWYGGILGVGEYSFRYGLSNWLVFGVPYYVGAALFAIFLARRARRGESTTLPERVRAVFGPWAGAVAAVVILVTTLPAAYLLTLGVLAKLSFGWSLPVSVCGAAVFSVVYLWRGGFAAVVRTDKLQIALMYGGFALLLAVLVGGHGVRLLWEEVPASHWTWSGGRPLQAVVVWYFIALSSLVEPAFFQRAYAAATPKVAQRGLLLSILCWMVFDAMTTTCGFYARALMPDLAVGQAVEAFPRLALLVLPVGLAGIFFAALFATVMSTVDSYLFIVATTLGRDLWGARQGVAGREAILQRSTRVGLVLGAAASAALALWSGSVVKIWHAFGSVGAAALLVPVLAVYYPRLRVAGGVAAWSMGASIATTLAWLWSGKVGGGYWWGVEPIYVGLGVSVLVWAVGRGLVGRPEEA